MDSHRHCPNCDSTATEVVHTEYYSDTIERVRICRDCPVQYTVEYGLPEITDTTQLE